MEKVFQDAEICRLAIMGTEYPYIVPLNFGYEKGVVYFHSAREGQKLEYIKNKPEVCIQADSGIRIEESGIPCNWSTAYNSVIAYGRAYIIEEADEKRKAMGVIVRHYKPGFDEEDAFGEMDDLCVVKVLIESMTGKRSE